jgi:hypothetical protein
MWVLVACVHWLLWFCVLCCPPTTNFASYKPMDGLQTPKRRILCRDLGMLSVNKAITRNPLSMSTHVPALSTHISWTDRVSSPTATTPSSITFCLKFRHLIPDIKSCILFSSSPQYHTILWRLIMRATRNAYERLVRNNFVAIFKHIFLCFF